MLLRRASHQREGGLVRRGGDNSQTEIGDTRLGDDGTNQDAGRSAGGVARERGPRRGPERELTAGAVSDRADSIEVERGLEVGQQVDPRGNVGERLWPATAVSYTAVLQVPRGDTRTGKILAEPRHQRPVPARFPIAAMYDYDHRVEAPALGHEQLAELARVIPVAVQRAFDHASVAPSEHTAG